MEFSSLVAATQNPQIHFERPAKEVYLGVVEIRSHQGRLVIGEGQGEVIEYAVKMKRLPLDCMMDQWLAKGAILPALVEKIATKIAYSHAKAALARRCPKLGDIQTIRPGFGTPEEALQPRTVGKVNNQDFRVAMENLKRSGDAGEEIGIYLLLGFPGQTAGEIEESISAGKEAGGKPI
jgi:aminoglycoside phosphotransferase family enzyme